jgi:zinc/manganese transport system permease protein
MSVWHDVFQPGFFGNSAVQTAAVVGLVVACVCAPVGVFTVIRGQSFAGHAFADITSTGGSASVIVGVNPLVGFAAMGLLGAGAMELTGAQRHRGRDLATGIVLGAALGLSALFLYLSVTSGSTTGAVVTVMFGSIFAVSAGTVPLVVGVGAVSLVLTGLVYRPLLLSSVSADLAAAQGVRLRLVEAVYMVALALSVALCALTIGAILSTALLIGPAATALRLARSPIGAMACAAGLSLVATWAGIVLAYDSYTWPPAHNGWPVSFFVVVLVLAAYLLSQLKVRADRRQKTTAAAAAIELDRAGRAVPVGQG